MAFIMHVIMLLMLCCCTWAQQS